MSENLYEALEACLKEMEGGTDLETVLARRPQAAGDLRPLLMASASARRMAGGDPSPEVARRARANVMQKAAEMRETGFAPRGRSIPALRRLLISFALAFLLLLSGSGLLRASASALPGERLYPVKRGWENVRLMFAVDPAARTALETQFYYERLSEVAALLSEGRVAPVEFAGIYIEAEGQVYVSGIRVVIPASALLPSVPLENGMAVLVRGRTTAGGAVQADSIQLLPGGSEVPAGTPPAIPPASTSTPAPVPQPPTLTASPAPGADGSNANSNVNDGGSANNNDGGNANNNQNDNRNDNDGPGGGKDNGNDNDNDNDNDDDNDNDNDDDDNNNDGDDD